MPAPTRPGSEWYSPYFTPTTIIVATVVLLVSLQIGRFAGNLMVARDRVSQYPPGATTVVTPAHRAPAKAAHRATPAKRNPSPLAKTVR